METAALDSIRNTAKVFDRLQAPAGTSCALQAAFLHNVLIQHEAMREQRTSSHSHRPAALAAIVDIAPTYAQTRQRLDGNPSYDDQNTGVYASEDASTFDMRFMDDDSWAFMFANAGFNIGQGAFMSPT
jgi:hypothetical protein